ncbi:MAG: hypothetical protein JWO38_7386 [Gemmataceae bacterium]|nr:hypothetical protein [Gemmataceae bacterium]
MIRKLLAAAVVAVLGGTVVAADLKSGPQSGEKVPGPFHPLNVTGDDAGKKACLFCKNGDNPVAVIFARTATDPNVTKLIKALDAATEKNAKAEMGSFVVYLSGDDKLEAQLKDVAKEAGLKKIVLSIESPEGPSKYKISPHADVTVLLYKERVVAANYAFGKGKLTEKDVEQIVADVSKITPAK